MCEWIHFWIIPRFQQTIFSASLSTPVSYGGRGLFSVHPSHQMDTQFNYTTMSVKHSMGFLERLVQQAASAVLSVLSDFFLIAFSFARKSLEVLGRPHFHIPKIASQFSLSFLRWEEAVELAVRAMLLFDANIFSPVGYKNTEVGGKLGPLILLNITIKKAIFQESFFSRIL